MAAKIYSGIDGIEPPKLKFGNFNLKEYEKECSDYIEKLKEHCPNNPKDVNKLQGETIRFQVADGYAQYMVLSIKPLELIHLPFMDAWESDMVELLTIKKVQELVTRERNLRAMFAKK